MKWMLFVLSGLGLIAILTSLLVRFRGFRDRADVWLGLALLLLLPVFAVRVHGYIYPPAEEDRFVAKFGPRTPAALFGARFVSGGQKGGFYDLVVKPTPEGGAHMIRSAGMDAINLGRWMARLPERKPAGDVALTLRVDVIDRYGATSSQEVLTLRWPGGEWAKVQWETITPDLMIALAEMPIAWPVVHDNVRDWCDDSGAKWKPCARFTSGSF